MKLKLLPLRSLYLTEVIVIIATLIFYEPTTEVAPIRDLPLYQIALLVFILVTGFIAIPIGLQIFVIMFFKLPSETGARYAMKKAFKSEYQTPSFEDYFFALFDQIWDFFH